MSKPSVQVENLGKLYKVYPDARHRLKEWLTFGRRSYHTEKWALRGIDFELWPGQGLGVVGINGAGKSTLLKILTGTTRQSEGRHHVEGLVSSMLELGAGFHPDFSGKQNIYMNAALQGVPKEHVDRRYEEIADFAELGPALERPVRTYSSGMAMRLGFAASMLVEPDVLIMDEVLAVGDAHFQKKCMDQFRRFRSGEKTILFVSHSVYHVREICDRVIWIHDGRMVMDGDPIEVTDEYETRLLEHQAPPELRSGFEGESVTGLCRVERVTVARGGETDVCADFTTGDTMSVRVQVTAPESGLPVFPLVAILRNDGLLVLSARPKEPFASRGGREVFTLDLPDIRLLAGEYTVSAYLSDESGAHLMDQILNATRFKVHSPLFEKGIYLADYGWRRETQAPTERSVEP